MKKLLLIIFGMLMSIFSFAQTVNGLEKHTKAIKNGKIPEEQIAIIYAILRNTNEVAIHQQNDAIDNVVFVSKDGHQEAVFDKNKQPVQDGINDASYNYHHPSEQPLMHFSMDISPWITFGQSRQDSTTVKSRIYSYMGDLEGGIRRTLTQKDIPKINVDKDMQLQALATFFKAIEEGGAENLFQLFNSKDKVTDKQLIDVLTKLNDGFEKTYLP